MTSEALGVVGAAVLRMFMGGLTMSVFSADLRVVNMVVSFSDAEGVSLGTAVFTTVELDEGEVTSTIVRASLD